MRRILLALMMLCLATGATAQTERLERRGQVLGWEAVGRLDFRGGFCTGTLIATDIVLTAAHCVYDTDRGRPRSVDGMVFRAGYYNGSAIATRRVAKMVIAPGYQPTPGKGPGDQEIANDLALLRLATPLTTTEADPFRIHEDAQDGAPVTLVSYGRGRSEALTRESNCALTGRYRNDVLGFDCDATFGSSGAPVFVRYGTRYRIFSVVSAGGTNAKGAKITYGMRLPSLVSALSRELRNGDARPKVSAGARRLSVGQRTSGGARFVKVGD